MAKRSVTLADVAKRAGVSPTTVSYVLNRTKTRISISQGTRKRVQQAAKDLGYRPHPAARALRGKGTHLLGLILREIDDAFFAELVEVIRDTAKLQGYDLVLGYARSDAREALAVSEVLDLRQCDGLLLLGDLKESVDDLDLLSDLWADHHVVSVCRGSGELVRAGPSISVDNRRGVELALEYLVGLGHKRIAFLDTGRQMGDLWERADAYRKYMVDRFGAVPGGYLQSNENSYEGGCRGMRGLLHLASRPTAVLAADDTMAIGALRAAGEEGFEVPRDISLVGFDGIKIGAYLTPALTTIRQPIIEIGQKAVQQLLSLVESDSPTSSNTRVVTQPEFVIRESCDLPREV
jgi:DNA-binding LacI/PurR family transcriptional regulator